MAHACNHAGCSVPVRWDRTVRFDTVLLLIPYYTVKATTRRTPYCIYGVILEIRRSATALIVYMQVFYTCMYCMYALYCIHACIAYFCYMQVLCIYMQFLHTGAQAGRERRVSMYTYNIRTQYICIQYTYTYTYNMHTLHTIYIHIYIQYTYTYTYNILTHYIQYTYTYIQYTYTYT